ncbi:MAG: hypothetical protein GY895_22950 [Phycisphaera sp.]|nr:hypothetical protein [Phycisphaera sp.]
MTSPQEPNDPSARAPDADDDWRDILLDAVVEGRLSAGDRRDIEHRFENAGRPARRDAVRGEIEVLARFLALDTSVRLEIERSGQSIDLEVVLPEFDFAVHVKRLPTPTDRDPLAPPPPSLVAALRDVPRPYRVGVDWRDDVDPEEGVVEELRSFLLSARMGDSHVVRDARGGIRGFLDVLAPREGGMTGPVELIQHGDAVAFDRLVDRAGRLLRRAYRQFAPSLENVIVLVGGGPLASDGVDCAILGGHVERWDRLPRIGQRVAHGRDDQGLWTHRHYDDSRIVGWAPVNGGRGRTWVRENLHADEGVVRAVEAAMRTGS